MTFLGGNNQNIIPKDILYRSFQCLAKNWNGDYPYTEAGIITTFSRTKVLFTTVVCVQSMVTGRLFSYFSCYFSIVNLMVPLFLSLYDA